jgi:hypothetical protein
MKLTKVEKISRIIESAQKVIPEKYPNSSSEINGDLLLWAIEYTIFDYIYKISPNLDVTIHNNSNNLAHWIHLRKSFSEFSQSWENVVGKIKEGFKNDVLNAIGHDETHPINVVCDSIFNIHELHVRQPKRTPANIATSRQLGESLAVCYNVITHEKSFENGNKSAALIFNPLPSDHNYMTIDPKEDDELSFMCYAQKITGWLDKTYDVPEQFSFIVTKQWGYLLRILHNIFHLLDYLNGDIIHVVDKHMLTIVYKNNGWDLQDIEYFVNGVKQTKKETFDDMQKRMKSTFKTKEEFEELTLQYDKERETLWINDKWEDIWLRLVTDKYANASMTHFKKVKGVPEMVAAIAQIQNIVNGGLKLYERFK